jgi:hypothetical protein
MKKIGRKNRERRREEKFDGQDEEVSAKKGESRG